MKDIRNIDERQKRIDLKFSLGCLLEVEAWKLPCCGLPSAGRAQCPRTHPAPSFSSLLSAKNRVRACMTEQQLSKDMCDGTVWLNCTFIPTVNVYYLQMLTIRNTYMVSCNYSFSQSYGGSDQAGHYPLIPLLNQVFQPANSLHIKCNLFSYYSL